MKHTIEAGAKTQYVWADSLHRALETVTDRADYLGATIERATVTLVPPTDPLYQHKLDEELATTLNGRYSVFQHYRGINDTASLARYFLYAVTYDYAIYWTAPEPESPVAASPESQRREPQAVAEASPLDGQESQHTEKAPSF